MVACENVQQFRTKQGLVASARLSEQKSYKVQCFSVVQRCRRLSRPLSWFLVLLACCTTNVATASGPRVLPEGELPADRRLEPLKDLNGYFPFIVPATKEAWNARAEHLRRRVLVSTGLWPLPERTPLNASVYGRVERDGFTVEKVYFESVPQHFVTGLLFRPTGKTDPCPAVLCPHGHGGRLQDYGAKGIREQIVQGAERFEECGRYPKLARCAQLARMGCVVFIYDMLGYADSVQISRQLAHGFAKQRPELDTKDRWGFYSTQAELRLQSIMGLQTWNSVRALDFLCSLPDVDAQQLGVTGGSGGGTQTILLCAIDPRPVVAFPQGMVSTAMQGGCTCENCSLLRVGTGNVELAALFAPEPQGMTTANDWTKEMMTKGFPELQQLYALLDAESNVMCKPLLHFPHNYNYVTRAIMYSWFNKHLKLGLAEPVVEEAYEPLTPEEYTVWDEQHPRPAGGDAHEQALIKWMDEQSTGQIDALLPTDAGTLASYHQIVGGGLDVVIGRALAGVGQIERESVATSEHDEYVLVTELLRAKFHGEELPVVSLAPKGISSSGHVVIWVDGEGKAAVFDDDGSVRPEVMKLLRAGATVIAADLLYQGEFTANGESADSNRIVNNSREFAGYTFGYNHSLFAQRVHDILTIVVAVRSAVQTPKRVSLVGVGGAGPWVAAALAQAGSAVDRGAIDTGGFRFVDLPTYRDGNFLPGAVKYGDLPAMLALFAPGQLWIVGEGAEVPREITTAYDSLGTADRVTAFDGEPSAVCDNAVKWLLQ